MARRTFQSPSHKGPPAQAQTALRESEERFRAICEHGGIGIALGDLQGRLTFANHALESMLGYEEGELIGRNFRDFTLDKDLPLEEAYITDLLSGVRDHYRIEKRYLRKNGEPIWVALSGSSLRDCDGRPAASLAMVQDISDSKRAEAALRTSNARFENVLGHLDDDFAILGAEWRFVYVNDAVERHLGRPRAQILGKDLREVLPQVAAAPAFTHLQAVLRERQPHTWRERSPLTSRWLNWHAFSWEGGVAVITRDITDRVHAEEAQEASRQQLQAVIDNAPAIVYAFDLDERLVIANMAVAELFNSTPEQLIGKRRHEFMPKKDADWHEANDRQVIEVGRALEFEEYSQLEGRSIAWLTTKYPLRDVRGRIYAVGGISTDITERKRTEEALRKSEQKYRVLTENAPAVIQRFDTNLRILYISPSAEEATGLDPEQLIGKTNEELGMPVELCDLWNRTFHDVAASKAPQEVAFDFPGPNGGRTYLLRVVPEFGADGSIESFLGISTEITERKRSEDDLRKANLRLAEADRRKDEFLAMLGHELRNPLSVMGSASEILQRVGGVEPEVRRARDALQRQVRHMTRLVDDLLDVTRVTQGKIELRTERVRVADVFRQAVEAATPMIEARGHKLFVSLPSASLSVDGDAVRLTQIVANVLSNAVKYTQSGGEIYLSAERRGERVEMRVRDNGQGIDSALLPHVFDLFVQGDRGADRAQGGLGIGLTMARSLVEMHGGTIDVHSDGPGTGTELVIRLPLPCPEPASRGADAQRQEPPVKSIVSRRILVVDDNADAAEMMRTLLELDGHQVTAVHDGRAAIEHAVADRPDVALIDLGMPGMDGFDVARRLRAEPCLGRMALVAVTGYGQEEDVRRSHEAGFDHHVTKSADFEPLRRVLDKIPDRGQR